jgi:hypothetical protein
MKTTNAKRWLISGVIACVLAVFGNKNDPPKLENCDSTFNHEKNEWSVSGVYQFTKLHVYVFPVEFPGYHRTGEFALRIPDNGSRSISTTQYEKEALAQARQNAGPWIPNIVIILLAIAIGTVGIRLTWWFFQEKNKQTKSSDTGTEAEQD